MGAVWGIADQEAVDNGAESLDDMRKQGGLHMINRLRADAGQRQMRRASLGTIAWSQEGIRHDELHWFLLLLDGLPIC